MEHPKKQQEYERKRKKIITLKSTEPQTTPTKNNKTKDNQVMLSANDAACKLLTDREAKHLSHKELTDLFFTDFNFVPL